MLAVLIAGLGAISAAGLDSDQEKMLKDPGGWQYIKLSDPALGVQTQHPCFDGQPHPNQCSGTLTLSPSRTFVESLQIEGKAYDRHGTYRLTGDQLTLFDELGTRDGPYTVSINSQQKTMVLQMSPAGGGVRCEFVLNREYRKRKNQHRAEHQ